MMTLHEASTFFKSLAIETTKKSEIKIYEDFVHILNNLESSNLSKDEIETIEVKLASLHLESNPGNRKKYYKKSLIEFKRFLKHTFSLTLKGHYTNLGIGLGSSFGILFGVVVLSGFERSLGISLGLIIGMLVGLTIGQTQDVKAKSEGRMI